MMAFIMQWAIAALAYACQATLGIVLPTVTGQNRSFYGF